LIGSIGIALRRLARGVVLAAACAVAACATAPAITPPPGGFAIVGRFAVKYGEEAASGRITWRHDDATDELVLSTPLGQGIAEITRRNGMYDLLTASEQRYSAADAATLTEQALGWALPLEGLPDWLRGRPQAGIDADLRYDGVRLAELRQLGWRIEYSGYDEQAQLPKRLRLRRGDLDIRLAIDEWQTAP
jgi:outer membrane lipoprotein LolB